MPTGSHFGLRLGLSLGQSKLLTFFFWKVLTIFEQWQRSLSCMNVSQPWTARWSSSLYFSISRYLALFIIIAVAKRKSPAVPLLDIAINHDTGRIFHYSLGIAVIVSCASGHFLWYTSLLFVDVILEFDNYLMNSRFAIRHFVAYLPFKKSFFL